MASVYILFSLRLNKFYIGSCLNIDKRLLEHKNKTYLNSYTKIADDWELYTEINELDGVTARKIEKHIKSMKSTKYLKNLKEYPEMRQKLISKFSENK